MHGFPPLTRDFFYTYLLELTTTRVLGASYITKRLLYYGIPTNIFGLKSVELWIFDEKEKVNNEFLIFLLQFTIRNGRGRFGIPGSDRKPLVLSTYLDAQEHLPYADDSNAVTPMSEENGAIIVPVYYGNLGSLFDYCNIRFLTFSTCISLFKIKGSRHSSYTSHQSRISYTSHGDLLGGSMTKESKLRNRSSRNQSIAPSNGASYVDTNHKSHREYVSITFVLLVILGWSLSILFLK